MFLQQLEYKSKSKGGSTIKIDRFYPSTKTCSDCNRKHLMPLSKRQMQCDCGLDLSRDLNAAINIKKQAVIKNNRCGTHRIYACGDMQNIDEAGKTCYIGNNRSFETIKFQKKSMLYN